MRTLVACAMIATLSAAPQIAVAQSGNAPFCLKTGVDARPSCSYATMADCERAKRDASDEQCITQTDTRGTTGMGDGARPPRESPGATSAPPPR